MYYFNMERALNFNPGNLVHILVVGVASYLALIFILRVAGKRTLSRMNAYDMVITMALGSILARVILTPDQSIAESIFAMLVLVGLQYAMSILLLHIPSLRELVTSKPAVLFHKGEFVEEAMHRERLDRDEVQAAIHSRGISDNSLVEAVLLGRNGDLSVLLKPECLAAPASSPPGEM